MTHDHGPSLKNTDLEKLLHGLRLAQFNSNNVPCSLFVIGKKKTVSNSMPEQPISCGLLTPWCTEHTAVKMDNLQLQEHG